MDSAWWYLFKCGSGTCLPENTQFSVRSTKKIKAANCPVCGRECESPIGWVADVDGGGGPDEPVVAYIRGTITKIRNDVHNFRKDTIAASRVIAGRLEALYGLAKDKWAETSAPPNGE